MMVRMAMLIATAILVTTPAQAGEVKRSTFGKSPDGHAVAAVTLTNRHNDG